MQVFWFIPTHGDSRYLGATRVARIANQAYFKRLSSPSLAGRMAVTFDQLSNGRPPINIVTGGDPVELAGDGLFLNHDERHEVTDEFLRVWRGAILRETNAEAWAAAEGLIRPLDDDTIARAQQAFGRMDSEGPRRMWRRVNRSRSGPKECA